MSDSTKTTEIDPEALYRMHCERRSHHDHFNCRLCGMRNSIDNLSMCKKCGEMYCSMCIIDHLNRVRKCSCGGEIEA